MIKNKLVLGLTAFALSSSLFFSSCVRERDTDISMAKDGIVGDFVFDDAFHIVLDAATKSSGETLANYKTTGYCATLTHDTNSSPRSLIIDFGTANCMCNDSRNRRGKIIVSYTKRYADSGNIFSFSFDNYFVNDYQIMGTQVVENKGRNVLAQTYYTQLVEGKIMSADTSIKDTLKWNAEREITWVEGESTPMWFDDIFETVGKGNGRGIRNEYYAMNITKPLIREAMCRFIKGGRVELQPQGKALRTIDYGDGDCDNQASVEINSKRFAVDL